MQQQSTKHPAGLRGWRGWLPMVLAVAGVCLLLMGNRIGSGETASDRSTQEQQAAEDSTQAVAQYRAALCAEIEAVCRSVSGAGEVRVIVGLEGGFAYLYATDHESKSDGEGGEQTRESYVTVGSGSAEQGVLLSEIPPRIAGIGVVCEGGEDQRVRAEIVALLSAVYGIGSNRIFVSGGQ